MVQISTVQLKSLLNATCIIVDNVNTFLLNDLLNLLRDGCLQCSNGARVDRVDVVLEELLEEDSCLLHNMTFLKNSYTPSSKA